MSIDRPEFARISNSVSRSISAENPTGEPGAGGRAASALGPGRKGAACISLPPGSETEIARIKGPGVIRHMWFTLPKETPFEKNVLRNVVLKMTWDGAQRPAVEVPIGDFFGSGFGEVANYWSQVMISAPRGGFGCYLPMPFRESAVISIVNEHSQEIPTFFYQVDFSLGDELDEDDLYLHAFWSRTNGTNRLAEDHVVVDVVEQRGAYVGTYVFITQLESSWYGEGEVKFFIDGDNDGATISGTGLEDYVGGAWAFQDHMGGPVAPTTQLFCAPYSGYHQKIMVTDPVTSRFAGERPPCHGMYRWHLPDPIRFTKNVKVTLQQIGNNGLGQNFERADDVSTVAFWYSDCPSGSGEGLPGKALRRPR